MQPPHVEFSRKRRVAQGQARAVAERLLVRSIQEERERRLQPEAMGRAYSRPRNREQRVSQQAQMQSITDAIETRLQQIAQDEYPLQKQTKDREARLSVLKNALIEHLTRIAKRTADELHANTQHHPRKHHHWQRRRRDPLIPEHMDRCRFCNHYRRRDKALPKYAESPQGPWTRHRPDCAQTK